MVDMGAADVDGALRHGLLVRHIAEKGYPFWDLKVKGTI